MRNVPYRENFSITLRPEVKDMLYRYAHEHDLNYNVAFEIIIEDYLSIVGVIDRAIVHGKQVRINYDKLEDE